jgi:hypothetical protein
VGVEGKDWEEVARQTSQSFWKLMEGGVQELRVRLKKRKK